MLRSKLASSKGRPDLQGEKVVVHFRVNTPSGHVTNAVITGTYHETEKFAATGNFLIIENQAGTQLHYVNVADVSQIHVALEDDPAEEEEITTEEGEQPAEE